MKNLMKRLTVFAVLVAMLMSMMTPVFADEVTNGDLTVTGPSALAGKTVKAYQLFTCVVTTDDSGNVTDKTYTIKNDTTKATLAAALGVTTYPSDVSVDHQGQYLYDLLCEKTAAELLVIANTLKAKPSLTATSTTTFNQTPDTDTEKVEAKFTGLGLGYYLLVSDDVTTTDADGKRVTKVVNPIIVDFTENMTVSMKTEFPEVDKTVKGADEEDAAYANTDSTKIGKVHKFKLETVVPDVTGKEEYAFNFVDTYSEGLTLVKADKSEVTLSTENHTPDFVTVTMGGTPLTDDGTVYKVIRDINDPNTFRVIFVDPLTTFADHAGEVLKVEYYAKTNNKAEIGTDAADNETYLEYTHNGDIVKSSKDRVELTYFGLIIDKYTTTVLEGANVGTVDAAGQYPLNGAQFKLYKIETVEGKDTKVYYVKDAGNQFSGDTYTATILTSGVDGFVENDGKVVITDLELPASGTDDTYYLEETTAPKGYGRYVSPIKIVVSVTTKGTDSTEQVSVVVDDQNNPTWTIRIQNEPESWLPSTGSMGTYLFIAAGVILIIGATLLRKRKVVEK